MKRLTGLVVITLVALGCSAAFGQVQFGLLDSDGVTPYCDYIVFSYGTSLATGIDVNQACGYSDGTLIGVTDKIPASTGLPVTGPVVVLADSTDDAFEGGYGGLQVLLITQTKASNPNHAHFGFEAFFNVEDSFDVVLYAWGYLTKHTGPIGPLAEGQSTRSLAVSRDHNLMKK